MGTLVFAGAEREERRAGERDVERARESERKIANIKTARQRRKSIREARVAKAQIVSGAQAAGTSQTSSVSTGVGAVGTQLAANLSFLDQVEQFSAESSLFQSKAAKHVSRARDIRTAGDIFQQAGEALSAGGGG